MVDSVMGENNENEIHEILDEYTPFTNWKNVSRALYEIIDLVGWVPPDERDSEFIENQKVNEE